MTTITWVRGIAPGQLDATSGNWDDATSWSPQRIPDNGDDVFIGGNPDTVIYTVSLGASDVCNSLLVSAGNSGVNLQFAQNGTLDLINGGGFGGLANGTGQIMMAQGSTLQVDINATFAINANETFNTGTLAGAGTIRLNGGTQTLSGTVLSVFGLTLQPQTQNIGETLVLGKNYIYSGTFTQKSSTVDLQGKQLLLTGGGSIDGVVTDTTSSADNGFVETSQSASFTFGVLTIGGEAGFLIGGAANFTAPVTVGNAMVSTAELTTLGTGTINLTSDAAGVGFAAGSKAIFENIGTLAKTGGTGTSVIAAPLANTGTIRVDIGTLEISGGGSLAGAGSYTGKGAVLIDGNNTVKLGSDNSALSLAVAQIFLGSGNSHGTAELDAPVSNSGKLTVTTGGKVEMQGNNYSGSNDTINGVLDSINTANWSEGGTSDWDGAEITGAADVEITIGGIVELLAGNAFLGGTSSDTDTWTVDAAALLQIEGDVGVSGAAGSSVKLIDNGTVEKTGGSGNSGISCFFNETATGTIMCSTGDIDFTGGEDIAGALSGGGVIEVSGNAVCTFETGCSLTVGTFYVGNPSGGAGANATLMLNGNVSDNSTFDKTFSSMINLGGNTLTLGGNNDVLPGLTTGSAGGKIDDEGSIDFSNATLDGGITVLDDGTIILAHPLTLDTVTLDIVGVLDLTADTAGISQGIGTQNVVNTGTIAKTGGAATSGIGVAVTNNGTMTASSGTLSLNGSVSGTGMLSVGKNGGVQINAAVGSGQTVNFADSGSGALVLSEAANQLSTFQATIAGLTVGTSTTIPTNGIDITRISPNQVVSATLNTTTDVLTITPTFFGGPFTFQLSGSYAPGTMVDWVTDTGGTGSEFFLSQAVACFCRGTLILTDHGDSPVEELAIGDRVVTLSGELRPIKWIGRRAYDPRFIRGDKAVLPVRIAAGALGSGIPRRDLCVSPQHAMFIDGALVMARLLVNGATILQLPHVDSLEYFHIELDTHDLVLAEGAPAETYVARDNRNMFHNAADFAALYPGDGGEDAPFCAPRLDANAPELAAIHARLAPARAA